MKCEDGDPAPTDGQVGQVYRVNPTGNVNTADQITLLRYTDAAQMETPAAPSIQGGNADGTVTAGSTVRIMWDSYTCPAGAPQATSYTMTVSGGVFNKNGESTASFAIGDRPQEVVVDDNGSQALSVTYTVTCNGDGTERVSGDSAEAAASIVPAQEQTPPPADGGSDESEG